MYKMFTVFFCSLLLIHFIIISEHIGVWEEGEHGFKKKLSDPGVKSTYANANQ